MDDVRRRQPEAKPTSLDDVRRELRSEYVAGLKRLQARARRLHELRSARRDARRAIKQARRARRRLAAVASTAAVLAFLGGYLAGAGITHRKPGVAASAATGTVRPDDGRASGALVPPTTDDVDRSQPADSLARRPDSAPRPADIAGDGAPLSSPELAPRSQEPSRMDSAARTGDSSPPTSRTAPARISTTGAVTKDDAHPELPPPTRTRARAAAIRDAAGPASGRSRVKLHIAAAEWVAAAHLRDIDKLMALYARTLTDFEGAPDVSRGAVRREKEQMLAAGEVIAVVDPPMWIAPSGRTATTHLRLRLAPTDGTLPPADAVRELGWVLTADGWKIDRERDITAAR